MKSDDFVTALVNRGILPGGTTRVLVWAGNKPDGLGGYESHIEIIINNSGFDDVSPIPDSTVNVPNEIQNLGG
jgi:hypothetical protein